MYRHLDMLLLSRILPETFGVSGAGGLFQWDLRERLLGIMLSAPEVEITVWTAKARALSACFLPEREGGSALLNTFHPNDLWRLFGNALSGELQPEVCAV